MPKANRQQPVPKPPPKSAPTPPPSTSSTEERGDAWPVAERFSLLLYGESGTGKTTLWATFPKPIQLGAQSVGWLVQGIEVPWGIFTYYTALLAVMAACFLGIGMLISSLARTTDMAQGAAFLVWLTFLLFLDLILLGVMIQGKISPELAVTLALANPLQVFRTAALAMFDPQLIVLGPSAYVILDLFGAFGYKIFALVYPLVLGVGAALAGFLLFRRGDLP